MEPKVISVGYDIPGHNSLREDYSSEQSLLDAEFSIFTPGIAGYESSQFSDGGAYYGSSSAGRIREDTEHWKSEIGTACDAGKTVFVFMAREEKVRLEVGRRTEGSGRNSRTVIQTDFLSSYDFLPLDLPEIVPKYGTEIAFAGDSRFSEFWAEYKDILSFGSYFDEKMRNAMFLTKVGSKTVGALFKCGAGHIVLLPELSPDDDGFQRKSRKGEEYCWTAEGKRYGRRLLEVLAAVDVSLRNESARTPLPKWLGDDRYSLRRADETRSKIRGAASAMEKMRKRKAALELELEKNLVLRDLLFEKGKLLENAVTRGLQALGFTAEGFEAGGLQLDQVIVSPEGDRFVGEVEGKDNAPINVDKMRQLVSNIQEDASRAEVLKSAVGILFGNGSRRTPPEKRGRQFTDKCVQLAGVSHCALVQTSDLFIAARRVEETGDQGYAKACRESIAKGIGTIVQFPVPTQQDANNPPAAAETKVGPR